MMSIDEVKTFQKAINTASWKLDLWALTEILGSNADHDWTKEKFRQLSTLSGAIAKFDAETLTRIINAATEKES